MALKATLGKAVTTAPTTQTAMAAVVGGLVTTALQLLQTYARSFHAPSAATVALIVAWLTVVASHLTASASSSAPASPPGPPQTTDQPPQSSTAPLS